MGGPVAGHAFLQNYKQDVKHDKGLHVDSEVVLEEDEDRRNT